MIENAANKKLPEILAPAGNFDKFRAALLYGANAIYLGGKSGNLRASSSGLSKDELALAVREAAAKGASVYYCLNSFPFEHDLAELPAIIEEAAGCGVAAFILADPGLLRMVRKYAPGFPVHLSTQANTTNSAAVKFWLEQGVSRVNLARELDCSQIAAIRQSCPEAELEVFVHGAMCLAVSGQCLLSAWLNRRPANQGQCTQPCRFEYKAHGISGVAPDGEKEQAGTGPFYGVELTVEEALRPGQPLWRIEQNEKYSAFWAPDDLCLLPYLPWFIANGITALKIEGRMKSAAYVAHVADVYSSALKAAAACTYTGATCAPEAGAACSPAVTEIPAPQDFQYDFLPFLTELLRNSSRPLTSGFFLPGERVDICRKAAEQGLSYSPGKQSGVLARLVEPAGPDKTSWVVDVKENWRSDEPAELMLPGLKRPALKDGSRFENHRGELSDSLACGTRAVLHLGPEAEKFLPELVPGVFIRRQG